MKWFFVMVFVMGCSRKYQTYHAIDKYDYQIDNYEAPISGKLLKKRKVSRTICSDQVFFASNAEKSSKRMIEQAVKSLCPEGRYITDAKLTEDWWTTIVYSRSCMKFEGYCAKAR